jgi:hypothetical protein
LLRRSIVWRRKLNLEMSAKKGWSLVSNVILKHWQTQWIKVKKTIHDRAERMEKQEERIKRPEGEPAEEIKKYTGLSREREEERAQMNGKEVLVKGLAKKLEEDLDWVRIGSNNDIARIQALETELENYKAVERAQEWEKLKFGGEAWHTEKVVSDAEDDDGWEAILRHQLRVRLIKRLFM